MTGRSILQLALAYLPACAASLPPGGPQAPFASSSPAPGAAEMQGASPEVPLASVPDVDLRDADGAVVRGSARVPFDGMQEGLAWPALDKALSPRKAGDVVTLQVARAVPTLAVLRAAWTLRQADLRVQSADSAGTLRVIGLDARRAGPVTPGCHLAVFLQPDGSLRVASPGGPVAIAGDDPAGSLVTSLADEGTKCFIKYVAVGAESDGRPWGPVFDVIDALETSRAAGHARFVLAQALHVAPRAGP